MEEQARDWIDLAMASLSLLAFAVSLFSLGIARRSQRMAESQDRRRQPKLEARLLESQVRSNRAKGARSLRFHVSVSNLSDNDNSVAAVELRLEYKLRTTPIAIRIPLLRLEAATDSAGLNRSIPKRIAAHETVAGWLAFEVDRELLAGREIDRYALEIRDSHGNVTSIETSLLIERTDAQQD